MKYSDYILHLRRKYVKFFFLSLVAIAIAIPLTVVNNQQQTQLRSRAAENCPYGGTVLSQGSAGDAVRDLQNKLLNKGHDLGTYGVDGQFGPVTKKAVQQFQHDNQVGNSSCNFSDPGSCDGIVGPQTWGALCNVDPQELQPPPGNNPPGDQPPNTIQQPNNGNPDQICIDFGGTCVENCISEKGAENCTAGRCGGGVNRQCFKSGSNPNPNQPEPENDNRDNQESNEDLNYDPRDEYDSPPGNPAPPRQDADQEQCQVVANCNGITYNQCELSNYCENRPENGKWMCRVKDQYWKYGDNKAYKCTYGAGESSISLAVKLQGIGVNAAENSNPVTNTVMVTAKILKDSSGNTETIASSSDTLSYNTSTGNYENENFSLGTIDQGEYKIILQIPGYLDRQLSAPRGGTTFSLEPGETVQSATAVMAAGDVAPSPNGDNFVNIIDYNVMLDCVSSGTCSDARFDINDDGVVDETDLELIEDNIGDEGYLYEAEGYTCTQDPSCNSGQDALQMCRLLCEPKRLRS